MHPAAQLSTVNYCIVTYSIATANPCSTSPALGPVRCSPMTLSVPSASLLQIICKWTIMLGSLQNNDCYDARLCIELSLKLSLNLSLNFFLPEA